MQRQTNPLAPVSRIHDKTKGFDEQLLQILSEDIGRNKGTGVYEPKPMTPEKEIRFLRK